MKNVFQYLKNISIGDLIYSEENLKKYSRDASLFEIMPEIAIIPQNARDIKNLVKFVSERKKENPNISLTVRAGGTDMTGGSLNDSIIVDMKNFNHMGEIDSDGLVEVEPGFYYRDFEDRTLAHSWILPSYPASKNICMLGGMLANNSGGERTLKYGKTENYVEELDIVLADGEIHNFKKLSGHELKEKISEDGFESEIFKKLFDLIEKDKNLIDNTRPIVSKNSGGYNIWKVWDGRIFDINKLFIGSQGTLGIITKSKLRLIRPGKKRGLLVVFMKNFQNLGDLIGVVLKYNPVSFESFDNHTFKLALKFFFEFAKLVGAGFWSTISSFVPEFMLVLRNGIPRLTLLVEFEEEDTNTIKEKQAGLIKEMENFDGVFFRVAKNTMDIEKFFAIRRESFNLLRKKIKGKQAAPFIDDLIVSPTYLSKFLPELYKILDKNKLLYTIAGHMGDGNFHIIPLMDLSNKDENSKIFSVMDEVYDLVLKYHGLFSAEHNDGLIRSPYLEIEFGPEIYKLFREIKNIFDPLNIFNPHKKTDATLEFSKQFIKTI